MIAYARGVLAEKAPTRVVLEAAGLGYEIFIPLSTYERLPREGEETKLFTHHAVKEDDETLFGFATAGERETFRKLISVSGVGPKIALALLSGLSAGDLLGSIASGDSKRLAGVKGVGKKTAEKICVELRDKVDAIEALSLSSGAGGKPESAFLRDAALALRALGFGEEVAAKMVADAQAKNPNAADTETIIRLALGSK